MTGRQPGDAAQPVVVPNGYRIIVPPGWVRIPLRHDTERALEDLVFSRLKNLPPEVSRDDGMAYRLTMRRAVTQQIGAARQAGGLDLYLPLTTRYRIPLAASFLVSEHAADASAAVAPEVLLARLVSPAEGGGVDTRELAGTLAVRREHLRAVEPDRGVNVATRRVGYALPVPNDQRRMLSVVFSTPGDGDPDSPFTMALTELFDASMMTFRWTCDGVDINPDDFATDRTSS